MSLGKATKSGRGFSKVVFKDSHDKQCEILCSSAIDDTDRGWDNPGTSYLHIGLSGPEPIVLCANAEKVGLQPASSVGWQPYPIPDDVFISTSMHLSREQVAGLIVRLQEWLDNGKFGD
jgi:hypothetical protein